MAKPTESSEEQLHLLYLDWCSTQVARRFLELSHDEVWLRSHSAAMELSDATAASSSQVSAPPTLADRIPEYLELVRRTALHLAEEMRLPTFLEWREAYSRDPDSYQFERLVP